MSPVKGPGGEGKILSKQYFFYVTRDSRMLKTYSAMQFSTYIHIIIRLGKVFGKKGKAPAITKIYPLSPSTSYSTCTCVCSQCKGNMEFHMCTFESTGFC